MWPLAVIPTPNGQASQGVEAWPSCSPVVSLLALGIVVLELQLGNGTDVLEPAFLLVVAAFLPVVAEVATASFRQAFPWFGVTAVDDRPSSFSPEDKRVRILVASKTLLCFSLTEFQNSEHLVQNALYFIWRT